MNSENIKTKLVTIELFDGTPKGLRQIEFETELIKAVVVPRTQADKIGRYIDSQALAVYLLIGENSEGRMQIYVGQTKRTQKRANEHGKHRTWWNEIIYFINRAGNGFTAGEADYLEWLLVLKLVEAKRVMLDNGNNVSRAEPLATSGKKASFASYYNQIVSLTEIIGLDIFNKIYAPDATEPVFFCRNGKGANASGYNREDGFYVLSGSECVSELTPTGHRNKLDVLREKLIHDGVLRKIGQKLIFVAEYKFKTPSGASQLVLGTNSNGWLAWKDDDGKTLDEYFRHENNAGGHES